MTNLFIPILLGTAREGRQSERVAKYVYEQAKAYGQFETELLDVKDFVSQPKTSMAADGPMAKKWKETMARADGLIIVSPEYNHSYPGELKLMLDDLYAEFNRKPLGVCGVSAGPLGGARMIQALRLVVVELQMVNLRNAVYFAAVQNIFDDNGNIKDEAMAGRMKTMFDELMWYAQALKAARGAK
ncbi:MAG: NAD(P)H-dependent oxidoreductase [Patescibacteria group bacterium]